jgi:hypothetical protein
MPRAKLMKTVIDALRTPSQDIVYWDTGCPGFGIKITPKGRKVFARRGGALHVGRDRSEGAHLEAYVRPYEERQIT